MTKSLLTAALALAVSNSFLPAQESPAVVTSPTPSAPATSPAGPEALSKKVGAECTVYFRNDIYASMGSSNYRMTGKLVSVSKEWLVLSSEESEKKSEQWIPRGVIFYIEFSQPLGG